MSDVGDVGQWLRQLRPFHRARIGGARVLLMHGDVSEHLRDAGAFRRYGRDVRRVLSMSSHDAGGRACKWGHDLFGDDSENEPQALVFEPGRVAALPASGRERELVETRRALDRSGPECAVA